MADVTITNDYHQTSQPGGTTETITISVASGSDMLVVGINWNNEGTPDITSVVWDAAGVNESLTEIGTGQYSIDDSAVNIWVLEEPTAGASKDVTVTWDTTWSRGCGIHCYDLDNVDLAVGVRDYDGDNNQSASSLSAVLSSAEADDLLLGFGNNENITTASWGSSTVTMTEDHDSQINDTNVAAAHGKADGTGETVTITFSTADHCTFMACAIKPIGITYKLEGYTYDKNGDALGSCECFLFKTTATTLTFVDYTTSNASTGAYSFTGISDNDASYLVYAVKDNTPHVFDCSDHVLQPVLET